MTREEAIRKMEYSKRAYQMLIDEKVQEGVLVGQGINAEWSADTPIIDAYKDMLEACDMALKALEQEPKWIPASERLPEDYELVLFSTKTDRVFEGRYFADNTDHQWYAFRDECFAWNNVVTAWMPLPEPYMAESEDIL